MRFKVAIAILLCWCAAPAVADQAADRIDREALVTRHNPSVDRIDPHSPFMVGNGDIAFTADITGLQTFEDQYSPLVPLMTQAQWAWHSFPNPNNYKYEDSLVPVDVRGQTRPYAWFRDWSEAKQPHIAWLRENPHRFSLGRASLHLTSANGAIAKFSDLTKTAQTLDMWTGTLSSSFVFDGEQVHVQTRMHPDLDMLIITMTSPLVAQGRLGIDLKFPGVAANLNPNPADWNNDASHRTSVTAKDQRGLSIERQLDDTRYFVKVHANREIAISSDGPHSFSVRSSADSDALSVFVLFSQQPPTGKLPSVAAAVDATNSHWKNYWQHGGVVDFSGSTDPRALELERRIVLSQYLMALNAAGTVPPQEEGLFSNSWNGKFHMEMHLWHAAHFATWGRTDLLERSMPWYLQHLPQAKARARSHGLRGAWWPKMVGPEGRDSPSTISPFIMWQQPHPIYLAELIYRDGRERETLTRYRDLVMETADLLASFLYFDKQRDEYVLGPPVIPAQEVFPPLTTFNPTFELEYFRFGLKTAQQWRERLGLERNAEWDRVLRKLSPLPENNGLYLATESFPQLWEQARSAPCANGKTAPDCWDRDHPSFLAAFGLLPGSGVDEKTMRRTLEAVENHWDLRQTWGWDFPMIAMTAARLHEPEKALKFLFLETKNNQFGVAGMTPRVHLDAHADNFVPGATTRGTGPDGPGYRRAAEAYFPSNGSLLLAVGLMTAGWDGEPTAHPGFPKDGWVVRSEGLRAMP